MNFTPNFTPRLALALALTLAAPLALAASASARSEHAHGRPHVGALRDRQAALQSRQQRLSQQLSAQRARAARLKRIEAAEVGQLTQLQQKLEQTATELQDSQYRLRKAEFKLNITQEKLQVARREFGQQQRASAARLRAIYKNTTLNQWEALLTAPDMGTFMQRYHFFKRISEHDSGLLENLHRKHQVIHQQQNQYAVQRQTIAKITQAIGTQKVHLADMTEDQQSVVSRVKSQRQAAEQVVSQLEADSNQIEAMIRRLIAQRQELERQARLRNPRYQRPPMGTGRFSWPCAGVITSPYGYRMHPVLGRQILHHGLDLGASIGTPIYAPDNGEVVYAGWYGGYGKVVMIYHGGDLTTLFGHTNSYVVSQGQRVRKGQLIAYVGTTGMSTGPHLHFEVRKNGATVNPLNFLR